MHRLLSLTLLAAVTALVSASSVSAQQRQQARPLERPPVFRDRPFSSAPPPPPSSDRNFYGPAPGIQQPMERVPQPAPLAQPPTNR